MDLLGLHTLSVHLRFDSAYGPAQVEMLRALHDRMLHVLMLSSAVDDAMAELRAAERGPRAVDMADPHGWRDLLQANLATGLAELEQHHASVRVLPVVVSPGPLPPPNGFPSNRTVTGSAFWDVSAASTEVPALRTPLR